MDGLTIAPPTPVELNYGDKKIMLTRPKLMFLRTFKKRLRNAQKPEAEEDIIDVMFDYCVTVGVPDEVLADWGLKEMTDLFTFMNKDDEKKS
jgi:hypothetical protein